MQKWLGYLFFEGMEVTQNAGQGNVESVVQCGCGVCVAVWSIVVRCGAVWCSVLCHGSVHVRNMLQYAAVSCSELQ